jgi:hypothetical protein
MAGALSGLGLSATGCGAGVSGPDAGDGDAGFSRTVSLDGGELTFDQFFTLCEQRGGLVQTTAACAGNNSCRGLSYLGGVLIEHSCKGMNGCGPGMQCVDLPTDQGRSGKAIYTQGTCAPTCHGQFSPSYDAGVFTLHLRPGSATPDEATARFLSGSRQRLRAIIGFGVHGIGDLGIAYASMAGSYQEYSLAETDRVIDYIRTLPVTVSEYEVFGPSDGGLP